MIYLDFATFVLSFKNKWARGHPWKWRSVSHIGPGRFPKNPQERLHGQTKGLSHPSGIHIPSGAGCKIPGWRRHGPVTQDSAAEGDLLLSPESRRCPFPAPSPKVPRDTLRTSARGTVLVTRGIVYLLRLKKENKLGVEFTVSFAFCVRRFVAKQSGVWKQRSGVRPETSTGGHQACCRTMLNSNDWRSPSWNHCGFVMAEQVMAPYLTNRQVGITHHGALMAERMGIRHHT